LFAHAFVQRRACGLALLGRDLLRVEIDAGLAVTIAARCAIDRSEESCRDEPRDGLRKRVRAAGVEREGRHLLGEQAEGSFDMRFVLRALGRWADAHRVVERCIDFGGGGWRDNQPRPCCRNAPRPCRAFGRVRAPRRPTISRAGAR
jgi:hypothetical protein